jgi:four helix bundle protein
MDRKGVLRQKSFSFSVRVVNLYKYLKKEYGEYIISKQIIRAGTSIGAMIREAEYGESTRDFAHKLHIALKEAHETAYWLELLYATGYINKRMFDSMSNDLSEILKMLVSSIKTIRSREILSS